jgi:hypothetical protein
MLEIRRSFDVASNEPQSETAPLEDSDHGRVKHAESHGPSLRCRGMKMS